MRRRDGIALALVLLAGCKAKESEAPGQLADDLAQIEAELQARERELEDEGIVVAYRERTESATVPGPAETPPAAEVPVEPVTPEPTAPTTEPPPEPTEEPAPPPDVDEAPSADAGVGATDVRESSRLESRRSRTRDRDRRDRTKRRAARKAGLTRCERVCELAQSTCDLQGRICDLASQHPDDVRYEDACRRAEDQCTAAQTSCESCAV